MRRVAIILFLFSYFNITAQSVNPEQDEIYREEEIAIIKITMDSDDKTFLLADENVWSDEYLHAGFQFVNSLMDTVLVEDVGIRLRGNTSRTQPKRSFKIKFKEFDGGKFFGYKKFNLKAENNDPSMVRELLSMQTFRNANVAATRTHHTEVYINDEYMGIYLNVEQLDDEFVDSRFGNEDGNLYKCTWPATLENDNQVYNNDIYELKTNKSENDRAILAHFVDVLNTTSDDDFKTEIEKVFDVQPFIRYLAVEALLGHWDGYSYNKNNFYLYENPNDGLITFMPYDTDNTYGIDWVDRDWGTRDMLDWPRHGEGRPLVKRILAVEVYRHTYAQEINKLLESYFSENALFQKFDEYKSRLSDPISRDTYFPLTFGFSSQDFNDSYNVNDVAGHLPYGLKQYVTARTQKAAEDIEKALVLGIDDFSSSVSISPNPVSNNTLVISLQEQIPNNSLRIYDLQGVAYQANLIKKSNAQYQVIFEKTLPVGMYVITFGKSVGKFIVE